MIVIVDDERGNIAGVLEYLKYKSTNIDPRYDPLIFDSPDDAIKVINNNKNDIDIIISDIGMYYENNSSYSAEYGGSLFINDIDGINKPIIIYSIHQRQEFEKKLNNPIDNRYIHFVNKNDDANSNELYPLIDKILEI